MEQFHPLFDLFCNEFLKVSLRLRSNLLYQKFVMNESPATVSLRSATPKKNVPCFSDFNRDNKLNCLYLFKPPHSTTVNPSRIGVGGNCNGETWIGLSKALKSINTRNNVSGFGVISRGATLFIVV